MSLTQSIKDWARRIKQDAIMLWFAKKHPDTPLLVKVLAVCVVVYLFSPIDLIPDFIPVLGYVDDAILVPAMIWCAVRLLPEHVIATCRIQAQEWMATNQAKPRSYIGAAIIIIIWLAAGYFTWKWLRPYVV